MATDRAVGFGYKGAWLAARDRTAAAVASALGFQGLREATWAEGIEAAYDRKREAVFLTPELGGWTLAVSFSFLDWLAAGSPEFAGRVADLSATLRTEVQFFGTYRVDEDHAWALARNGKLVRAFYHSSVDDEEAGVNVGPLTPAEKLLGFDEFGEERYPSERDVTALAAKWSVDPTRLDGKVVGTGFLVTSG